MTYNADGQINTTVVNGLSYTGVYAADGSWNIVLNDNSALKGLYHPCGAYNAVVVTDPSAGFYSSNGSMNVIANNLGGYSPVTPFENTSGVPNGGINLAGTLPMDSVAATWTAAYGIGALTSAWTTAGNNLFDIVGGTTIKTIAGGYPDVAALATALGVSPTTGIGAALVTKWYDQSGNARDAVQPTTANQPWLGLVYGKVTLFFSGVLSSYIDHPGMAAQFFNLPASVTINTQSASLFALIKPYTTTARTASSNGTFFGGGTLSTVISNASLAFDASGSFFSAPTPGSTAHVFDLSTFEDSGLDAPNLGIQRQVISCVLSASAAKYRLNGYASLAGAPLTAAAPTGGNIGSYPAGGGIGDQGFCGRMYGVLISSSILTDPQEATVRASLQNILSIPTGSLQANVVFDGASLDQGQGGVPGSFYTGGQCGGGYSWTEFVMDDISNSNVASINWHNVAGSGYRIDQGTSLYTDIGNWNNYIPGIKNIWIGPNSQYGNSFAQGKTQAEVQTDFLAYMALIKSDAWDVVATIVFPEDSPDPNGLFYENLVRSNAASVGYEILEAPLNFFDDPTNLNGDHISVLGYRRMATAFLPQIKSWIGIS